MLPQTAPDASTPRDNPYMPIRDIKAPQFMAASPGGTYDGRGTTIAILDSGIDLDHPEPLRTTTNERKVIGWYNANATNSGDGTWVNLFGDITAGATFSAADQTWTTPATGGPYAFGRLFENAQDLAVGELGADIDRDGVTREAFGVLQDRTTKEV